LISLSTVTPSSASKGCYQRHTGEVVDPAPAFDPYSSHSIHIPLGLVIYRGASWGAKVLYGRLALFRGSKDDGYCNPNLDTMAVAMGTSVDTIERWLAELIQNGFIKRQRRRRRNAECIFLPHPCLLNSADVRTRDKHSDSPRLPDQDDLDSADSGFRCRKAAVRDSADLSPAYIGRKHSSKTLTENETGGARGWKEFQAHYPEPKCKTGVEAGAQAYAGRIKSDEEHAKLMAGLERYLENGVWRRSLQQDGGRYIPNMSRFIREGLYLEDPPVSGRDEQPYRYVPPGDLLTPEIIAEYRRKRGIGDA